MDGKLDLSPGERRFDKTLAILVGGGPAPGINGVIRSAAIEGIKAGLEVIETSGRMVRDPSLYLRSLSSLPVPKSIPLGSLPVTRTPLGDEEMW